MVFSGNVDGSSMGTRVPKWAKRKFTSDRQSLQIATILPFLRAEGGNEAIRFITLAGGLEGVVDMPEIENWRLGEAAPADPQLRGRV
jgi:hypothetical protein